MEKQILVFDLDNTLTDYDYTNLYAMKCIYNYLNLPFDEEEYNRFQTFELNYWSSFEKSNQQEINTHGMDRIDYVRSNIYQEWFKEEQLSLKLCYKLMKLYIKSLGVKNKIYPDVIPTLEYLDKYYDMYIASNGPHEAQARKLRNTSLDSYFKGIVASEDAKYSKPDDNFYKYLFDKYNIVPEDSCFIGDSLQTDILGANNNNMASIWINRSRKPNNTNVTPDIEIHNLEELKRIL